MKDLKAGINAYFNFYNTARFHQSLDYNVPDEMYKCFQYNELERNRAAKSISTLCSPLVFRRLSFSSSCFLVSSDFLFGRSKMSAIPAIACAFHLEI